MVYRRIEERLEKLIIKDKIYNAIVKYPPLKEKTFEVKLEYGCLVIFESEINENFKLITS
jgi:hypothetical protein